MKTLFSTVLCSLILLGLVTGCEKKVESTATGDSTMTAGSSEEANKATMKRFYDEVINGHNVDAIDGVTAPEFIDHNPDPGMKGDRNGVKESFAMMMKSMPDAKVEVHHMLAEGDLVAAHCTMSGTMTGDMGPMKATGKSFSATLFDLVRFKDGKAVERWGAYDAMAMMTQLGMMPPPPGAPAEAPKMEKK